MVNAIKELDKLTYALIHNPNCFKPYEVRLVGKNTGVLDYKNKEHSKDAIGHGDSFEEAAENAVLIRYGLKKG